MRKLLWIALPALAAIALAAPKHGKNRSGEVAVFYEEDQRIIADYYRAQPSGLPPGLAKRNGDLPPGLERQLRRNGRLPPGLEKRLTPFPAVLERRLRPLPAGLERGLIGGRAFIYNRGKSLILDTFVVF